MRQLRLVFALEIVERPDTHAPANPSRRDIVTTAGEVIPPRPLAKCKVVAIAPYLKRRSAGR